MGSILKKRKRDTEEKYPSAKKSKTAFRSKASVFTRSSEKKSVDTALQALEFNTVGGKVLVNATVPGNGIQNRGGRKIRMDSLHIQGHLAGVYPGGGVAGVEEFGHILVVYDKQPNGAAFALADLIQSTDSAGATSTTTFSFLNLSNSERFKVLRHEYVHFAANGANTVVFSMDSTDYKKCATVNMYIPLKGLPTQYNTGSAGTIADIQTGSLYVMVLSNAVNGTSGVHQLQFGARLRFTDL